LDEIEIKLLGYSNSKHTKAATRKLIVVRCKQDGWLNAVDCIKEAIDKRSYAHFFVATQDTELSKELQKVPDVPLIYVVRKSLFLKYPFAYEL